MKNIDKTKQDRRSVKVCFEWDISDLIQALLALGGIITAIWYNQIIIAALWAVILFQDFAMGRLKGKISTYKRELNSLRNE